MGLSSLKGKYDPVCSMGHTNAWFLHPLKIFLVYLPRKDQLDYGGQSEIFDPFLFNFTRKLMTNEFKMWFHL